MDYIRLTLYANIQCENFGYSPINFFFLFSVYHKQIHLHMFKVKTWIAFAILVGIRDF